MVADPKTPDSQGQIFFKLSSWKNQEKRTKPASLRKASFLLKGVFPGEFRFAI